MKDSLQLDEATSLIIIPTIKTLPTTNISSQNRKYGAQKSSKKTDTNKKSSSSSNTKTTSSGAGGSMIPGSQQFHITDKRYEVIKQILYETEKPDLSSLTQEDLERHETIERAWKLFCRHQKEQKELELARKYRMLNEANIELEKVDERLFKEAQLNNSKILFPGKMKIPTETPPLDGWNYNYTKPITTTIVNKDNEVVDEVDESIKLQNNDKENKENQNDDNDILKDGSDINQQKLNDESNQDLVIIIVSLQDFAFPIEDLRHWGQNLIASSDDDSNGGDDDYYDYDNNDDDYIIDYDNNINNIYANSHNNNSSNNKNHTNKKDDGKYKNKKACALYDFLAENTSELSFQEGDILTINYRQCVGWLVAELDGKIPDLKVYIDAAPQRIRDTILK
ncbi:3263_t:CDS:2 [Entrophospora sp. SA101]|nr:3263_t:CDS:2 [Entrophospora sp. SA101]